VKRNRKGRTRTGAIPTCMAEVSPARAQRMLWARKMAAANAEVDRFWDEAIAGWQGAARAYGYDGVRLFAQSHPPQGACTCMVAAPFMRPTTSVDDCARHGEA
jgi:hypothetical protein